MWAWILHRLTGVGVLMFLLAHILDTAAIGWGPAAYNRMIELYRMPVFRVGEVVDEWGRSDDRADRIRSICDHLQIKRIASAHVRPGHRETGRCPPTPTAPWPP